MSKKEMTLREHQQRAGRAGRGACKARTSEQARAAALARWAKKPYPADEVTLPKADVPPKPPAE